MIRSVRTSSRRQQKKAMQSRCFVNGVEVTRDCFYADDQRGIARVYVRDANGRIGLNSTRTEATWKELRGQVRLERAS
jgi:hypothetical protein